jgi:hypothetical protein
MEHEDGHPKILSIVDEFTASSGMFNSDRYPEFEHRFGRAVTEAALADFYREQREGRMSA